MGKMHSLIAQYGVDTARTMVTTKAERQVVEAAAEILAEEDCRLGITHAGFAMTALPHKRIEETFWERSGGPHVTLQVSSGLGKGGAPVGVPYGSIARMILLYLQTEAIRTGCGEVELGRSMSAWMGRMGIATGGKNYKLVAEQARRISACRLTFFVQKPGVRAFENGAFVSGGMSLGPLDTTGQGSLWQEKVKLDDNFLRSLRDHPVPVREEALRIIGTKSMAIDIYIWLAYRLHVLSKPTPISWLSLHNQFGGGFAQVKHFKPTFNDALTLAMAVYPEARVDIEVEGLVLHPSPPAIPKVEMARLGLG
ncbi:Plasmid encoded RepA protein [Roseomonas sp. TAS13]|jgi:hypothetical protein|uniref:replication protein RepA n=1 Tax=Roseomonas sp. TAS13 TaxID=1926319 RepID=UPI00095D7A26|nr:replication protein RepA [Roseomonas sp. TAS13]GAV35952.1 Plasmid encoded RepA protein [Roseomonas sp. TAS13]